MKTEKLFYVGKTSEPTSLADLLIAHGNCGGGLVHVEEGFAWTSLRCSVCGCHHMLEHPELLLRTVSTGEATEDMATISMLVRFEPMPKGIRAKLIPQGLRALRRVYELEEETGRLERRIKTLETANDRLYVQVARLERMLRDLETAGRRFADAVYRTRKDFQSSQLAQARKEFLHKIAWLGLS